MLDEINDTVLDAPSKHTRITLGKEYWQEQMDAWQASGLSQSRYCRENNLSMSTFNCWKRKLIGLDPKPKESKFVPLKISQPRKTHNISIGSYSELNIITPNGFGISVSAGTDYNQVIPLIKKLCEMA
jgi:hypothetical protein